MMLTAAALIMSLNALIPGQTTPIDLQAWSFRGGEHRIAQHLGREALFLNQARATLKHVAFRDGVIEFDLALSGNDSMATLFWRQVNEGQFEALQLGPRQSGGSGVLRYAPVFNGVAAWQLYSGRGFATTADYPAAQWIPVRIEVAGDRAEIHIGNSGEPLLFSPLRGDPYSGAIGLSHSGGDGGTYLSRFRYQAERPRLAGPRPTEMPARSGTVMQWQVSEPMRADSLSGTQLAEDRLSTGDWQWLHADLDGSTNLARLHPIREGRDSVLARLDLDSKADAVEILEFGYSNAVHVYLNGRRLYSGISPQDGHPRTMSWSDRLYLPLQSGRNTVILAVRGTVDGWGLQARLPGDTGVIVQADAPN